MKALKGTRTAPWVSETVQIGNASRPHRWLIRDGNRVVKCFVEHWLNDRDTTHPFKIFNAICGQGPLRQGSNMLAVDYKAKDELVAAWNNRGLLC